MQSSAQAALIPAATLALTLHPGAARGSDVPPVEPAALLVDGGLQLPADLARRSLPPQSQQVDGAAILAKTRLPEAAAGEWTVEFAPLTRMQAWGVREPKAGSRIGVIGYIAPKIGDGRLLRVEYLFADGKAYGLRSSPAG